MNKNVFQYIRELFVNRAEIEDAEFKRFILHKNYERFLLLLLFAVIVSTIMLLFAEFSGDDNRIILANSSLLMFSIVWFLPMSLKRHGKLADWLFFIPVCVLIAYVSYLLGNFSYRGEFFSTYSTAMFIVAVLYTTSWLKLLLLFMSSMVYLYFFTTYVQSGPLSYSSVNIITIFNILFAAWFVSRVVYLSIRKEYESRARIKLALNELEIENKRNIAVVNELQDLKIELEDIIKERTKELQQQKMMFEQSDKTKSIYLSNMSHSLRTPLLGILGMLELLKENKMQGEESESFLNMALESTQQLKKIVDDILEINSSGSSESHIERISDEKNEEIMEVSDELNRILIAEDNKINRFLLKKILEENHYDVIEAENGEIAVESYMTYDIDAVLMDIQMPVMDGYTALSKMRVIDKYKYVPIIAITGYASSEDKNDIIESGFDAYLPKPFDKKNLLFILEDLKNKGGANGNQY